MTTPGSIIGRGKGGAEAAPIIAIITPWQGVSISALTSGHGACKPAPPSPPVSRPWGAGSFCTSTGNVERYASSANLDGAAVVLLRDAPRGGGRSVANGEVLCSAWGDYGRRGGYGVGHAYAHENMPQVRGVVAGRIAGGVAAGRSVRSCLWGVKRSEDYGGTHPVGRAVLDSGRRDVAGERRGLNAGGRIWLAAGKAGAE
ncbi:hypothetical protein B0H11DRAFT_2185564 [Mycena galericulata]|nr:hypothetical protein B0H11DRAFT_2185564 [Mycena galericulata]